MVDATVYADWLDKVLYWFMDETERDRPLIWPDGDVQKPPGVNPTRTFSFGQIHDGIWEKYPAVKREIIHELKK